MKIDFQDLASQLLIRSRELLAEWLPGGRVIGVEYTCATINGGIGNSFKANIKTGKWADFSTGERGGDLVSLYASINKIKNGEAAKTLSERYNVSSQPIIQASVPIPIPALHGLSPPDMAHFKFGPPTQYWAYKDKEGFPIFYVARYDPPEQRKQFIPWTYFNDKKWRSKAFPEPRPLYRLDELSSRPATPVLICEGEKSADAARLFAGSVYVVTTWSGGSQAYKKTDFSPLKGRRILLWPDADRAGVAAMNGLAEILSQLGVAEIKILSTDGLSQGYDAADFTGDWSDWARWAKPRASLFSTAIEGEILNSPPPEYVEPVQDGDPGPDVALEAGDSPLFKSLNLTTTISSGLPVCNVDNVIRVLEGLDEYKNLVWFDEFHCKFFTRWNSSVVREWRDIDDLNVMAFLQRRLKFTRVTTSVVNEAIRITAYRDIRNEPRDWMSSLTWDTYPRIGTFFPEIMGAEDNEYTQAVSKNFWISMVARVFRPGCKVDNMVILEGAQGKFKSTALSVIGGPWFSELNERLDSKDFYQILQGKFLLEISELDAFSKADSNTIKKMVSCRSDRFRAPYARAPADNPRSCIFVGTTNEDDYLRDHTGARRFWPVRIGRIDLEALATAREQLFAEALHRFNACEPWHEVPSMAADEQEARRQVDMWEDLVGEYLLGKSETTLHDVASIALQLEKSRYDPIAQKRLGRIMKALKWKKHNLRRSGKQKTTWVPVDTPLD